MVSDDVIFSPWMTFTGARTCDVLAKWTSYVHVYGFTYNAGLSLFVSLFNADKITISPLMLSCTVVKYAML